MPMSPEAFRVKLTRAALKDLKSYKGDAASVKARLDALKSDPMAGHALTGSLAGVRPLSFSLRGSGQHRALCVFRESTGHSIIFLIGPHENIYDRGERRFRLLDLEFEDLES
jgi:hypothetical protein